MSSITLKGIRKVYPIADDMKKKKKKVKNAPMPAVGPIAVRCEPSANT